MTRFHGFRRLLRKSVDYYNAGDFTRPSKIRRRADPPGAGLTERRSRDVPVAFEHSCVMRLRSHGWPERIRERTPLRGRITVTQKNWASPGIAKPCRHQTSSCPNDRTPTGQLDHPDAGVPDRAHAGPERRDRPERHRMARRLPRCRSVIQRHSSWSMCRSWSDESVSSAKGSRRAPSFSASSSSIMLARPSGHEGPALGGDVGLFRAPCERNPIASILRNSPYSGVPLAS